MTITESVILIAVISTMVVLLLRYVEAATRRQIQGDLPQEARLLVNRVIELQEQIDRLQEEIEQLQRENVELRVQGRLLQEQNTALGAALGRGT